jgi:hypothetical protein
MKKLLVVLTIGGLLALSLVASAQAQMPGVPIRASIPFDFMVRGKTLPAGNYEIERVTDDPSSLLLRNVNNKHENVVFETESMQGKRIPRHNVLVFNRYGDDYFLSEVVTAGDQTGRELAPSHAERTLRREMMAQNQTQAETVTVALY